MPRSRDSSLQPSGAVPILMVHFGDNWLRGSERTFLDLLSGLDRRKFFPIVWCNSTLLADEVARIGAPVYRGDFPVLLSNYSTRYDFGQYWKVVREGCRLVRQHRVRLIHANSGAPVQWMAPVSRWLKVPLVAHLHATYLRRDRYIFGLHDASVVVGISKATLEGIHADGMLPERTRLIYSGIVPERVLDGSATGLRAELGIPEGAVVVGIVASLIRRKGIDILLRAWKLLPESAAPRALLIVGEGPDREEFKSLAVALGLEREVFFLGERLPAAPILRDACDLFVLPSRSEALGLVFMEAGLCGLPAVGTRAGGPAEIIVDGETGFLVEVGDTEGLAAAMQRLIESPELRRRMGAAALKRIRERFLAGGMVEAFEDLYAEVIDRPPPAPFFSPRNGWKPYRKLAASLLARKGRAGILSTDK